MKQRIRDVGLDVDDTHSLSSKGFRNRNMEKTSGKFSKASEPDRSKLLP